jgi:hypothetical protein
MDVQTKAKFQDAATCVRRKGYELHLFYVTTGAVSDTIRREATERVRKAPGQVEFTVFAAHQVAMIFKDYLDGVAPAVPTMTLRVASEQGITGGGVIQRFDPSNQIESWVFSMPASDVGRMYDIAGDRLFARNIRGYLGQNDINEAMMRTARREPRSFWYYNNGITIVCDDAKLIRQSGREVLRVDRPQVINGQQTTRTLFSVPTTRASVLVKVVKIPREYRGEDEYDDLVSAIVRATNWQNEIRPSDLISNDYVQVHIERELRKRHYQYLRKRQSKSEARRMWGSRVYRLIKKDELARAIAACEFDPSIVLKGKEGLFGERWYRAIFSSRSALYYLSRYWLVSQALSAIRGRPWLSYAKWHVAHLAWTRLSSVIGSGVGALRFCAACEASDALVLTRLRAALDAQYQTALLYYRLNRGHGDEAVDRQTFYKQPRLHTSLIRFLRSARNSKRASVEYHLSRFKKALASVDVAN